MGEIGSETCEGTSQETSSAPHLRPPAPHHCTRVPCSAGGAGKGGGTGGAGRAGAKLRGRTLLVRTVRRSGLPRSSL